MECDGIQQYQKTASQCGEMILLLFFPIAIRLALTACFRILFCTKRRRRGEVHTFSSLNPAALTILKRGLIMSKYDYLREQYPQAVSKEQLYKICGIAKDTAWIFLHSGVIPCKDTGRKTRRYSIQLDDVISFLEKRDNGQVPTRGELKFLRPKNPDIRDGVVWKRYKERYFRELLRSMPDAVSPQEMGEAIGLSKTIIHQNVLHGIIEAAIVGRCYMIPKESVLAFMMSNQYQDGNGSSEK
jgi:hypothetical protein